MRSNAVEGSENQEVSVALAIGIALLPGLFVWFLMRRGHSTLARVVGFGWAGLLIIASIAVRSVPTLTEPSATAATASSQSATVATLASPAPETLRIEERAELSAAAKRFKSLYEELNGFRHDADFLRSGFDPCCRYHDWMLRVEELDRTDGPALFRELNVSPRELIVLGLRYVRNDGSTELTEGPGSRLEFALAPASPDPRGGRVMEEGWWCRDIETWFASLRAAEAGEYALATNMRAEPACLRVLPNMTTGPGLGRREYIFSDGRTRIGFVRVRLATGAEVWAPLESIEFR